ncbi:peptidoglycan/xylan/chitin deacetylase (PgdA/CDA1 family) [Paenarthrobacter nicotinovorans]|uniref:polysaccharide deacetylase family protein n=1 Tax=Micrococcaceae TaxID=1268 RepID=UPI000A8B6BF5|nr:MULTISPECIES: polysaccharide deacetylase family protein [Micrococcaceae]MDR6436680.1 peptidoglycan/xylan/chitin deacetylase (PgdA/CDA1 family) [Paenarthrobacter nicotinovorans]
MVAVVVLLALVILAGGVILLVTAQPQGAPSPLTSTSAMSTTTPTTTTDSRLPTSSASTVSPVPDESPLFSSEAGEPKPGESEPGGPVVAALPEALLGRDLEELPGAGNVVALTFDAGANSAALASILSSLSADQVKATFFVTGSWAQANRGSLDRILAEGHRLGNHSMSHPGFTQLTDAQITEEIRGAEAAVFAAGGDPRPFFRFPFGERDSRVIATVNRLGYVAVRWSVDTLGWKGTSGGVTRETVLRRVVDGLRPGAIVLMHIGSNPEDGTTLDADALPGMIKEIKTAGYGLVTLDQLLVG